MSSNWLNKHNIYNQRYSWWQHAPVKLDCNLSINTEKRNKKTKNKNKKKKNKNKDKMNYWVLTQQI